MYIYICVCVCVLVSLDINSVYKIIPNNKGIETIHETLNVQQKTKQPITTTPVIKIFLTFILTLSNFIFNCKTIKCTPAIS